MFFFSPEDPENDTLMLKVALVFVIPVACVIAAAAFFMWVR